MLSVFAQYSCLPPLFFQNYALTRLLHAIKNSFLEGEINRHARGEVQKTAYDDPHKLLGNAYRHNLKNSDNRPC